MGTLSKNNCHNCHLSHASIQNSSKKQKINEIRHFQTDSTCYANTRQGYRMYQITPLSGLKMTGIMGKITLPYQKITHPYRRIRVGYSSRKSVFVASYQSYTRCSMRSARSPGSMSITGISTIV